MKKSHVHLQIAKCNKTCGKILVNSNLCKYNWTSKMKGQPQPQGIFGDRWNPIPMPIPWAGWHLIPIMVSPSNLHWLMSNFLATKQPRFRFLIWREGGKRERVRLGQVKYECCQNRQVGSLGSVRLVLCVCHTKNPGQLLQELL